MLSWHGDELRAKVKAAGAKRLEIAALTLQNAIKQELVKRDNLHGDNPSEPGEAPAKVTGRLSSSISHEVDAEELRARVGTNVLYAKFLELGTRFMAARPSLRPVYERMKAELARILTGK